MKIYLVVLNFDNNKYYDEHYWYTEVEKAFSTREKALDYIKNWTIPEDEREEEYEPEYDEREMKWGWLNKCERITFVSNISDPGLYGLEIRELEID